MISVIIPTLWKPDSVEKLLTGVSSHPLVSEILLINNDSSKTPNYISNLPKIKILDFGRNIYVNPAWNAGVLQSRHNKICLLSDDTLFDCGVFDLVASKINPLIGTIGPHGLGIINEEVRSPFMGIVRSDKFWHGYGTLIFMHKSNYLPIPEEFLINFGDRWQYDYNAYQKRQNYFISQFYVKTKMGTTSSFFREITDREELVHSQVYEKMRSYINPGAFKSAPTVRIGD
jgi:glycosyltransferase involved in cell wall biosynthesis